MEILSKGIYLINFPKCQQYSKYAKWYVSCVIIGIIVCAYDT